MKRFLRLILGLMLISLSFVKCVPGDFKGSLPNDYELLKVNTTQIAIISPDRSPNFVEYITRMGIQGDLIFGKVDTLSPEIQKRRVAQDEEPRPGYFIINTRSNLIQSRLEKQVWLEELRKVGISREPLLQMPSSFGDEPIPLTVFKIIGLLIIFVFYTIRSQD